MILDRIIRFIGLIVFAIIGWQSGVIFTQTPNPLQDLAALRTIVPLTLVGAILGWFISPWLTTRPAVALMHAIRAIPIEEVVFGAIGMALGLLLAALLTVPLTQLPAPFGSIFPFLFSIIAAYIGAAVAVLRRDEFIRLFKRSRGQEGQEAQISPPLSKAEQTREHALLLDTSVIIDGRIVDVAKTGFLPGPLLVPHFVLNELQYIADSSDALRRARGRRGLQVLDELKQMQHPQMLLLDEDVPQVHEVDEKLITLAREHGLSIMTNDYNLNRVAALQGLRVLNLNELANAMKSILLPGERLRLKIIQEGKEYDQGVGYLDDGTMVVVENGRSYINREVDLTVTKVLQTSAGRMIFAQIAS